MTFPTTEAIVRYTKLDEIGQEGENSKVYKARDVHMQEDIAIKEVEKSKFTNIADYFVEAQRLSAVRHKNVVPILYSCDDQAGGKICLAMPLYWGSAEKLMNQQPMTSGEIVKIGFDFLAGLQAIHGAGLIHFDLKPDNLMIGRSGEALISDFGLAQQMNLMGLGRPPQMYPKNVPPEGFINAPHSSLYDIYGAGVTLYRMCVGGAIFQQQYTNACNKGLIAAIQNGAFPTRTNYPPHIPITLRRIINKAMHVDPTRRFPSALAMSNALAQVRTLMDWRFDGASEWVNYASDRIVTVKADVDLQAKQCAIHASQVFTGSGHTARVKPECRTVPLSVALREINSTLTRLD